MTAARRTQLARLGIWIGLATVAVLIAVFTARTETGLRRIAALLSPEAESVRSAKIAAPQIASRQIDQEVERRLNEAVRALAADRDRLASRVAALERNLDDVTGSISQNGAPNAAPAAQPSRPPPQGQAAPAPNPPLVPPPAPQAAAPQPAPQGAAPPAIQAAPNRVAQSSGLPYFRCTAV